MRHGVPPSIATRTHDDRVVARDLAVEDERVGDLFDKMQIELVTRYVEVGGS
ncbi:MAG: hypothetical protein ACRDYZ_15970 [Acidimicrobiales bacterium]